MRIPQLNWVLRGFYGHFFQPAPILTVSSSVLNYASSLGGGENTFTPLPSERDEEHQFGIEIPYRGWMLDVDTFKNRVNNFLDHSNLGESNMYFPIAVDGALVRAWEMTLHSPPLGGYGQFLRDVLEPDRRAAREHYRRIHVQHSDRPGLRPGPGLHPARPRPARHAEHGLHGEPAGCIHGLQRMCTTGRDFRTGWLARTQGPYNGNYLPVHTTFDSSVGHAFGERLERRR